jgi:hypothetical protein
MGSRRKNRATPAPEVASDPSQQTFNITARVTVDITIPGVAHDFSQAALVAGELAIGKFLAAKGQIGAATVQVRGICLA